MGKVMAWINTHAIVRRVVLLFTLYATWQGSQQAWAYAHSTMLDGLGAAAVITACLAPIAALQGFAFHTYAQGRKNNDA